MKKHIDSVRRQFKARFSKLLTFVCLNLSGFISLNTLGAGIPEELNDCKKLMNICFDVGNTNVFAGVLNADNELQYAFRLPTESLNNPSLFTEQLELFLRKNNLKKEDIQQVGICSVVPTVTEPLIDICKKTFQSTPFVLTAETVPFLTIEPEMAALLGTDMMATAVACYQLFRSNCIILDLGTATTLSAVSADGRFLGAIILSGIKTSLNALTDKAAQIPPIPLEKPDQLLGNCTIRSCQSGAYYGHLGAIKEITVRLQEACFPQQPVLIIGTGGLARLYAEENIFDVIDSDLILKGISIAAQYASNKMSIE